MREKWNENSVNRKGKHMVILPKIIKYLATRNASKLDLLKEFETSDTEMDSSLSKLQEKDYIMVSDVKPLKNNPDVQIEYYCLTFRGLVFALGMIVDIDDLEKSARGYKEELLIFQEWDSFKAHNALNEIMENLKLLQGTGEADSPFGFNALKFAVNDASTPKEEIKSLVNNGVLGISNLESFKRQKGIIAAVRDNSTLKSHVVKKFREDLESTRTILDDKERLLNLLPSST